MLSDDTLGASREDNSSPLNQRYIDAFHNIDADPNNELVVVEYDGRIMVCYSLHLFLTLLHPNLSTQLFINSYSHYI
jgi:hypothetical protein